MIKYLFLRYHGDPSNHLLYNRCFAYHGLPNVVSASMSVRLIVDLPTAISPNVYLPNQPSTKQAFIANLT